VSTNLTCPFKGENRDAECDREKCVLWHEGGCAFVHIAVYLERLVEATRSQASKY
jgi:hypothetical protein